jgi:hypothetical protein
VILVPNRRMETLAHHAAIGVRFWDVALGTAAVEGLKVEIFPVFNPRARKPMLPNLSNIYVGHGVPLLRDFEFSDTDPPELWSEPEAALRAYRIEVRDPRGRFLPLAFDADLPQPGLLNWTAPWFSPPQPIVMPGTSGSPPQLMLERIPLFSAPSRPIPDALAAVYAQMRDPLSEREAAWALLGVSIEGVRCGIGLADTLGRVAVMFPYPEPPRQALASPPEARSDFSWEVDLEVFWIDESPAQDPPPEIPDLTEILSQLDAPGTVNDVMLSPPAVRRLAYRVPLTARSHGPAPADASWLSVSAA